jgi:hypothetical protein
MAGY